MKYLATGLCALTGVGLWSYLSLLGQSTQWGPFDNAAAALTATWLLGQFVAAAVWAGDEWLQP